MASAHSAIVTALQHRVQFVSAQTATTGTPVGSMLDAKLQAMLVQIQQATGITLQGGTEIMNEVGRGPWTVEHRQAFSTAVSNNIAAPVARSTRPTQKCSAIRNFFTEGDWAIFESSQLTEEPKLQAMAKRLSMLGIVCPCEKLLMSACALLVMKGDPPPKDHAQKREMCHNLSKLIKMHDKTTTWPFTYITNYMDSPLTLPPEIYARAYGADKPCPPPPPFETSVYNDAVLGMCYRSNRTGVSGSKKSPGTSLAVPTAGALQQHHQQVDAMQMCMGMMGAMMQRMGVAPTGADNVNDGGINIAMLKGGAASPKSSAPSHTLSAETLSLGGSPKEPMPAPPAPAGPAKTAAAAVDEAKELEKKMVASAQAHGKFTADISHLLTPELAKGCIPKNFKCKAYDRAKYLAQQAGLSSSAQTSVAQMAYAKAAEYLAA
ncbi:unnamed protein product [Prorocentrum cordatum]|uniref:Uncharacterized protein n=1 Tax=Prorocentrum cordatum TaxID=2364126 RepID=A0ABN9Y2H5_9DINO|nr:unnamed protein product [Polarella glacialis]